MKATETPLLVFMQKSAQLIIPIYQRTYSWTTKECGKLWEDILRAGRDPAIEGHFIGSVVYVERGIYSHSTVPQLLVIDGQQRLATVSLIISALSDALRDRPAIAGVTAQKLTNYYLVNAEEDGELFYKLLLTQSNREMLQKIVCDKPLPDDATDRLLQNFRFYKKKIKDEMKDDYDLLKRGDGGLLKTIYSGLSKLIIVDIALDRDHDNPQLIFESLNSTGMDLSQADLIRNYVLMELEPDVQQSLYEDHWFPLEQAFSQGGHTKLFDRFMRDYLTVKTDTIPRIGEVYEAFKHHTRSIRSMNISIVEIVADVHRYGEYYIAFAQEREQDKDLREAFQDINDFKVDVAYPFLLELYADYREGTLERGELLECVRLVESYVFRRAVCEIPTNSLNKTFANLGRELEKDRYLESLKATLLLKTTYRRFPDDAEFRSGLLARDMYNMRNRNYWLRRMENYQRKERVNIAEYTVEHIMPQNENLSGAWQEALGENWQEVQKNYLHNLGNLTLTRYNPELSDNSFPEKRDMEGGFAHSPLNLNDGLGSVELWNREAILSRAEKLSVLAIEVWASPTLPNETIAKYRPEVKKTDYTLADHSNLTMGPIRELFEHLRNQILDLDSSVVEAILKHYIAYKLDTNFVDVSSTTDRLRLYLNMRFDEIQDPKGVCRDVREIGTWGNGDVEVGLNNLGSSRISVITDG